MKKLENKTVNIVSEKFIQVDDKFQLLSADSKTSYFELTLQIIRTPHPQNGLGDLEEQGTRLKLQSIVKAAIEDKKKEVEFEDADAKLLATNMSNIKYVVLDQGLVDFQKLIKSFGK
jgi:hypothetical protein